MNRRTAALLVVALTTPAHADTLGRLFTTPEQRALLDQVRRATPAGVVTPDASGAETPGMTVNGVVTRSDGRRSAWVNGRMSSDGEGARNSVRVQLPNGAVQLKVGQSIDPASGQVTESYRRPSPPPPKTEAPAAPKAPKKKPAEARDDDATPADDTR